jgi:hypothetical protein
MDNITWQLAVPVGIVLIVIWLWMKFGITQKIDDFFATRRHYRRLKRRKELNHAISRRH